MGRHRGENNGGRERQNARLISLLFAKLIVSVCALLLLLSVVFCVSSQRSGKMAVTFLDAMNLLFWALFFL